MCSFNFFVLFLVFNPPPTFCCAVSFPHNSSLTYAFIYWAATFFLFFGLAFTVQAIATSCGAIKERRHRWSHLDLFFIDKIVPLYNRQTKFDWHSFTYHRQRAMQTSITQNDGIHHFMVSFKASLSFTNLEENPQINPNGHRVKELAGGNYWLWCVAHAERLCTWGWMAVWACCGSFKVLVEVVVVAWIESPKNNHLLEAYSRQKGHNLVVSKLSFLSNMHLIKCSYFFCAEPFLAAKIWT